MFEFSTRYLENGKETVAISSISHAMQRTFGCGRLSLKAGPGGTSLDQFYQEGAARIRLPKTYDNTIEAVMINTAGGLTGGDVIKWQVMAGAGTRGVLTTQACEKIYKSTGDVATVSTDISVGAGARLDWLPQETILYDSSALKRTMNVDLEQDARFIGLEAIMLGREAMGERLQHSYLHDRWRIRRDGRLIHADDVKLDGDIPSLQNALTSLGGSAAFASLVYCGPEDQDQLSSVVTRLRLDAQNLGIGVSALDGKIIARFIGQDYYHMRKDLIPFLARVRAEVGAGADLPKVWNL